MCCNLYTNIRGCKDGNSRSGVNKKLQVSVNMKKKGVAPSRKKSKKGGPKSVVPPLFKVLN